MSEPRPTFFRFARHADAPAMVASGLWEDLGPLPSIHGHWSRLMRWIGADAPPVTRDADLPAVTSPWT